MDSNLSLLRDLFFSADVKDVIETISDLSFEGTGSLSSSSSNILIEASINSFTLESFKKSLQPSIRQGDRESL